MAVTRTMAESRQETTAARQPAPRTATRAAVEIAHLRKAYGSLVAVDDVSLTVAEGEIFGILGPNGAGKTTTVECATGLRTPDAGTVRLLGLDPHADRDRVHEIVGVQLQAGALPAKLKVGEILTMYRSFYRDPADAGDLLEALGLAAAAKRGSYYGSLSGGQKQRLSVGLTLSLAVSIAGLFPIGLAITAIARTANAASVIGRLAFFPLMFFAGLWLPRALMPNLLADISNYTPLGAAVQAIQDSILQGFPPAAPLLVLAGYALVFAFLARRFFRWE